MIISNLRTNHLTNPLGFKIESPLFTWTAESSGKTQSRARVTVSADPSFSQLIYDSGESDSISSLGFSPQFAFSPRTRYYWQVSVWADDGDYGVSDPAWFETGKMDEGFKAKWITQSFDKDTQPIFHKQARIDGKIKSARAYVTGLGLYELYINGKKAGDEVLAPFYNDYSLWLQYQTIDITDLLLSGENAFGAILGNGWYKGRFGGIDTEKLYGNTFSFLCEIIITFENSSQMSICSDESWLCHPSPVVFNNIYDGEEYNAKLKTPDWATVNFNTAGFTNAKLCVGPASPLQERLSPPVKVIEKLKPVTILHTPAGETVLDFGQIVTGWVEFNAAADVTLKYGEILQNDNFYNENLRSAKQMFIYVSDGQPAHIRPHFTYFGFRFVKVETKGAINPDDFTACIIHSDLQFTGSIETDNEKINRLFINTQWGQRGNFLDVPTDCPQRDERAGWTGDAQIFAPTASFHMYTPAFYKKYMYDMKLRQRELNGSVPHVIPDVIGRINKINSREDDQHGSAAWADAATVIPWTLYEFYADKGLLAEQYENMKMWVEYMKAQDAEHCGSSHILNHGFHFADWLALDNPDKGSCFGGTDPYYVATGYYFYSAGLCAKAAEILCKDEDAKAYSALSKEIKAAIEKEYFTPTGRIAVSTQTAIVMALYMDFAPAEHRERLILDLKNKLDARNIHLDTGFVGTPYLCPVLSNNGLNDYAYTLLLNEDFPSWLYEVNMGATTVWERWNSVLPDGCISDTSMNSLNHYAYGAIAEWMYRYMCGINLLTPGFQKALIRPMPSPRLKKAGASFTSAAGVYKSSWEIKSENKLVLHITVPFNATARFVLPKIGRQAMSVKLNGTESEALIRDGELLLSAGYHSIEAVYVE